jgi:predicted nicotinamide N-methyase
VASRRPPAETSGPIDPVQFIRANTRLVPVKGIPAVSLFTAHEATGLWRLAADRDGEAPPPYWAFPWAGGMALARYLLDRPETVAGRHVLDLGAGSGLVAIAAMKAGAAQVDAAEIDPFGVAAISLNAAANGVAVRIIPRDILAEAAPTVDVVLVGDLFYEQGLAERVTAFLDRCLAAGTAVLIGDPERAYLPYGRLRLLGEYPTPDVGEVENAALRLSRVFALGPG